MGNQIGHNYGSSVNAIQGNSQNSVVNDAKNIQQAFSLLDVALGELAVKIDPILAPTPANSRGESPPPSNRSALGENLYNSAYMIEQLAGRVREITQRVEI